MDKVDENGSKTAVSLKKVEANRRNSQLSTGPRTETGKDHSRQNALRHGLLASVVLVRKGLGAEDVAGFEELLEALTRDLAPIGKLEELMVEKIAVCCWRERRAQHCEAGLIQKSADEPDFDSPFERKQSAAERAASKALPLSPELDLILRYETAIQRQLAFALAQLERLQKSRRGEHVPPPMSIQLCTNE